MNELQTLRENRLDGEPINETKDRLVREGKLLPAQRPVPEVAYVGDEEGFFPDDLAIPRWRIVQPTCRIEGAKVGTFRHTLSNEEREKLENVVFLRRHNGRILFPDDDYSGQRECWSYDGLVPAKEEIMAKTGDEPKSPCCVRKTNGQKIVVCSFAMWESADDSTTPMCKETISFLGVDKEFVPFWVSFHGSAIPVVRKLISSIYLQKKKYAFRGEALHLRDFRLTLALKLTINEKGKFYVPVMEKTEEIKVAEERQLLTRCFEALQKREFAETVALEEAQTNA
jgi:hypothetical protein